MDFHLIQSLFEPFLSYPILFTPLFIRLIVGAILQGACDKSGRFVPKTEKYITFLFLVGFNSKSYMFF